MDTPRDERGKHWSDTKRGEKPPTVSRRAIGVDSWRMSATTVDQVRALTQLEKKRRRGRRGREMGKRDRKSGPCDGGGGNFADNSLIRLGSARSNRLW